MHRFTASWKKKGRYRLPRIHKNHVFRTFSLAAKGLESQDLCLRGYWQNFSSLYDLPVLRCDSLSGWQNSVSVVSIDLNPPPPLIHRYDRLLFFLFSIAVSHPSLLGSQHVISIYCVPITANRKNKRKPG